MSKELVLYIIIGIELAWLFNISCDLHLHKRKKGAHKDEH